jgi:integrase
MHTGTVALLRTLRARQAADRLDLAAYPETGDVLVNPVGMSIRPDSYPDRFGVLCRTAAVPVVRLYTVRHTLALMMHRANQAPADAAALLGHTVAVHLSTDVRLTEKSARTAPAASERPLQTRSWPSSLYPLLYFPFRQQRPADNWPLTRANRWSQGDSKP